MRVLALGAILLLSLALAPAAQAAVLAETLAYQDQAEFKGGFQLLHLAADTDPGAARGQPWVSLRAVSAEAHQFNRTVLNGPVSSELDKPQERTIPLGATEGRLVDFRGGYRLNLYTPGGDIIAQARSGTLESRGPVQMGNSGLSPGSSPSKSNCDGPAPTSGTFCAVTRAGPLLLHATQASPARAVVEAKQAILEVDGLDLAFQGDLTATVQSGTFTESTPAGPSPIVKEVFVRYILRDVRLEVAIDAGTDTLQWAATALGASFDGPVTLMEATSGQLGDAVPAQGRLVFPAGARLLLKPVSDGHLGADLDPVTNGALPQAPVPAGTPLLALAAAASLVAVGITLALRSRRGASLKAMETAITSGEHRRAARLAATLLRRNPAQEDAMLGRAIALTRSGRSARAAREVASYLERRTPTDGALHYVLGLAYLETGSPEPAKAALLEAARRTPQLEPEVRSRLAALPASPAPAAPPLHLPSSLHASKEASGYA